MLKLTRVVLLCLFILSLPIANAVTTNDIPGYVPPKIEKAVRATVFVPKLTVEVPETYRTMIQSYAQKYDVDEALMTSLIRCESSFNRYAINDTPGLELSVGLSQINLMAHTNVTRGQAEDPDFAIDFMAKHVAMGKAERMWYTCYTKFSTGQN